MLPDVVRACPLSSRRVDTTRCSASSGLSRSRELQVLSADELKCIEEYLTANPHWDWQLTDHHPLLALIARSPPALQKLLDKYQYTRGKLGAV